MTDHQLVMANPQHHDRQSGRRWKAHVRRHLPRARNEQLGKLCCAHGPLPVRVHRLSFVIRVTDTDQTGTFAKLNFYIAQGFIKLSITSFNMRLTGLSSRKWMYAHWAFFGIIAAFTIASVFLVTFQCVPVVAGFDSIATGKLETAPKCLTEAQVNHPLSIWNTVMDFMLLSVPVLVLWKVQIPWSTKIRLFLLFSVGAVCCFATVLRQVAQQRLKSDPTCTVFPTALRPRYTDLSPDNYTALVYWSLVDLAMSLIVASLPVLSSVLPGCGLATRKSNRPSGYSSSLSRFKAAGSHAFRPNPDLASKNSQEGIMRQDEVELQYHNRDPTGVEDVEMNRNNILGFSR